MKKLTKIKRQELIAWITNHGLVPSGHLVRSITIDIVPLKQAKRIVKRLRASEKLDVLLAQPTSTITFPSIQTTNVIDKGGFLTIGDLARTVQNNPKVLPIANCGQKRTQEITKCVLEAGIPLNKKLLIGREERRAMMKTSFKQLIVRSRILGVNIAHHHLCQEWDNVGDFIRDVNTSQALRCLTLVDSMRADVWLKRLQKALDTIFQVPEGL